MQVCDVWADLDLVLLSSADSPNPYLNPDPHYSPMHYVWYGKIVRDM